MAEGSLGGAQAGLDGSSTPLGGGYDDAHADDCDAQPHGRGRGRCTCGTTTNDGSGAVIEAGDAVEMRRILAAADQGKVRVNQHGRYVIDGGARPQRKVREKALRRGWIGFRYADRGLEAAVYLTDDGKAALARLEGRA